MIQCGFENGLTLIVEYIYRERAYVHEETELLFCHLVSFTFRKCYSTFRERKKKYKHGKVYIIIRNRKTFNFFIFTYF